MISDFAVIFRQLRVENDLRQNQVARLLNVDKSTISMYENDMRLPSYPILVRIADVFNVSIDYLLGRTQGQTLDISGLSPTEADLVKQLVAEMTAKNKRLEEISE